MNEADRPHDLSAIAELARITPPTEVGISAVDGVRRALVQRRRKRIGRVATLGYAAALIGALVYFGTSQPKPAGPLVQDAQDQLKDAVTASLAYPGEVKVRVEQIVLDDAGQPQAPATVTEYFTAASRAMEPPAPVPLPDAGHTVLVQAVTPAPIPPARPRPVHTIPIPLTWEGGTILIPVVPDLPNASPMRMGPNPQVTQTPDGRQTRYLIRSNENSGAEASVWVDPQRKLVQRIQTRRQEPGAVKLHDMRYNYLPTPTSQPTGTIRRP